MSRIKIIIPQKQVIKNGEVVFSNQNSFYLIKNNNQIYERNCIGVWKEVSSKNVSIDLLNESDPIDLKSLLKNKSRTTLKNFYRTAPVHCAPGYKLSRPSLIASSGNFSPCSYLIFSSDRDISYMKKDEQYSLALAQLPNGAILTLDSDTCSRFKHKMKIGIIKPKYTADKQYVIEDTNIRLRNASHLVFRKLLKELKSSTKTIPPNNKWKWLEKQEKIGNIHIKRNIDKSIKKCQTKKYTKDYFTDQNNIFINCEKIQNSNNENENLY